jgi:endonuclease/exonuclease/phosphatase family metal-dependent hydrolase
MTRNHYFGFSEAGVLGAGDSTQLAVAVMAALQAVEDTDFNERAEAQAAELLAGPADVDVPVICMGDFNSDAYGTGTDSYEILLAGGLTDAWLEVNPGLPGLTWGHDADLRNATPALTERLDLILFSGGLKVEAADVVGEEVADRTDSGLWLSDHAGVVADFTVKTKRQLRARPWGQHRPSGAAPSYAS